MDNSVPTAEILLPGEDLDLLTPFLAEHSITAVRPLTEGDARRSATTGPAPPPIRSAKSMRQSHHRAAQMFAAGSSPATISRLTAYSISHIYALKDDPAFQELVAYYETESSGDRADFEALTSDLSTDLMAELRQRLDEEPERISTTTLLDAIKTVSDRAGRAPVSRSVNANFNIGIGEKMRRAQARSLSSPIDRPPLNISPSHE